MGSITYFLAIPSRILLLRPGKQRQLIMRSVKTYTESSVMGSSKVMRPPTVQFHLKSPPWLHLSCTSYQPLHTNLEQAWWRLVSMKLSPPNMKVVKTEVRW